MSWMLLIIESPAQRRSRSPAEGHEVYAQMQRFGEGLRAQGKLLAVQSLASHADARRVQVREGKPLLLDGPFTEAKEMVGGFFWLDCASLDEATAIARQCPAAQWATVEVRATGPCYDDSAAAVPEGAASAHVERAGPASS